MSGTHTDQLDRAARDWLAELNLEVLDLQGLVGDVSVRRYFRIFLQGGGSLILATYPESIRDACHRFESTTRILANVGIPVPEIHAVDCENGMMLVEDAGNRTVYNLRSEAPETFAPYFEAAAGLAARIAAIPDSEPGLACPPLDADLLLTELTQTWDLVLAPRLRISRLRESAALFASVESLCAVLGAETPTICHRDFMVRNLSLRGPSPGMAVLDHQDMRLGPPFYDLASLLNDSLFPPSWLNDRILGAYVHSKQDRVRYHRVAAQRCLKAAGTYEKFARGGARRYRHLIRPTLQRAHQHLDDAPEAAPLSPVLGEIIVDLGGSPEYGLLD